MTDATPPSPHRVVIVGGGFGGLQTALALGDPGLQVTVVDRRNFHLFQPLLYQVATGALSPSNIATPLRAILRSRRNTTVVLAEAVGLDAAARTLRLSDGATLPYDTLVVASGSTQHYFGHPEWEAHAPGLKTVEDATRMRSRIYSVLERAERTSDPAQRAALMTFVVVGGGPTAVELAGAIAELTTHTVRGEFRRIDPTQVRVLVVEAGERILSGYPSDLSHKAAAALASLGVEVHVQTRVTEIFADGLTMATAAGPQHVPCACVLWGAGVTGSKLGEAVAAATGATRDKAGRIVVTPDCTVPGHGQIFVIGDLAAMNGADGRQLPGTAPVAMQQGTYVARAIRNRCAGRPVSAFVYHDRGALATIGKRLAVAQIGKLHLSGTVAWLVWVFVHLMKLVRFENRLLVLIQWTWNYITWNRNARLITGESSPPPPPASSAMRK